MKAGAITSNMNTYWKYLLIILFIIPAGKKDAVQLKPGEVLTGTK